MKKKILTITSLMCILNLFSCSHEVVSTNPIISETSQSEDLSSLTVKMAVFNGATGYGSVKLLDDAENNLTSLNYDIVVDQPNIVQAELLKGTYDIAAMPTNTAAILYNNNNDLFKVAAINTLGVLYLVTPKGETVTSLSDLANKTVGIPLNASYVLKAILKANPVENLNIEEYATPSELQAKVVAKTIDYAILPEPLLSVASSKNTDLKINLDLSQLWKEAYPNQELMQGCVVIRKGFIEEHPLACQAFLNEYKTSLNYVIDNLDASSLLVSKYFSIGEGVAKTALSRTNITYIDGQEMKTKLSSFYDVLKDVAGSGLNSAPNDGFYY